jgi:putative ABC transport system ATP-binding protein
MSLEIMGLFQQLNKQGKTIIMVTHEPELALRDGLLVSDRQVTENRSAMDDLAKWKNDNVLLSEES